MNGYIVGIIVTVLFVGVVAFFLWRKQQKRDARKAQGGSSTVCPANHFAPNVEGLCIPNDWGDWIKHQVDRPAGGWVLTEMGAEPDQKLLIGKYVEAGLRQAIAGATRANPTWTKFSNPADFGVMMIRKHTTTEGGLPALIVGKEKIKTAGTVINTSTTRTGGIPIPVLPEPDSWPAEGDPYWDYLQASARNEAEHAIEYANDLGAFLVFAVSNDVHPHWPLENEGMARGFASTRSAGPPAACLKGLDNDAPFVAIRPIRPAAALPRR